MKELRGRASAELEITPEECFELLATFERYPTWFEVVREVEILEAEQNGTPGMARAALHVPQSPFGKDFELFLTVRTEAPVAVTLTRVPDGPHDQDRLELSWRVLGTGSTRLELEFDAAASFVPSFLPVGGAGDLIAQAALDAARSAFTG
ncbi:MAG TPA: SRPBCC family protein [Solirubrobacteraceae bacterium]|nr:SRPBCC family protein [Solirubrobacteraceae bacterium]